MSEHKPWVDYSAEMNPHRSLALRAFFWVLGTVFVALGIAGAFLPVLPTTPFMLLAAACYARASTRFYNWLLNNPTFGPTVLEWRRHRSIPWRTKLFAIALMATTLGISIIFFVPGMWLKAALAIFGRIAGDLDVSHSLAGSAGKVRRQLMSGKLLVSFLSGVASPRGPTSP
jgi:uncharacterized protein